jgi:hypothetical protein
LPGRRWRWWGEASNEVFLWGGEAWVWVWLSSSWAVDPNRDPGCGKQPRREREGGGGCVCKGTELRPRCSRHALQRRCSATTCQPSRPTQRPPAVVLRAVLVLALSFLMSSAWRSFLSSAALLRLLDSSAASISEVRRSISSWKGRERVCVGGGGGAGWGRGRGHSRSQGGGAAVCEGRLVSRMQAAQQARRSSAAHRPSSLLPQIRASSITSRSAPSSLSA